MPVPSVIGDLDTTASNNSPSGSEAVGTNADNYIRAHAAFIAQLDALMPTGTVVGTSDTQTLTNKTIATGSGNDVQQQRKIVVVTHDTATASGTLAITGAGFTPRGFTVEMAGTSASARFSIGGYDGTTQHSIFTNVVSGLKEQSQSYVAVVQDAAGATQYLFAISSLDSDGCTLTTTKVGSPTGSVRLFITFWR